MKISATEDFDSIQKSMREIRRNDSSIGLPPLSIATGTDLDNWGTLYDTSRNYNEEDKDYRARIKKRVA